MGARYVGADRAGHTASFPHTTVLDRTGPNEQAFALMTIVLLRVVTAAGGFKWNPSSGRGSPK